MVRCPFHNDSNPSGRINIAPGSIGRIGKFRCYSCGHGASWAEFSEKTGLAPFPKKEMRTVPKTNFEYVEDMLLGKTNKTSEVKSEEITFFDLIEDSRKLGLREGRWRGFTLKFLVDLGAKGCTVVKDDSLSRSYLYFPVNVRGATRGYIKALPRKVEGLPGYFNAPGPWSHSHGLFLYDESIALMRKLGLHTLVLVEGPRDALRLYREGIPAIAILGTHSWSTKKVRLLELSGAAKIILCMDCDPIKEGSDELPAGDKAVRLLWSGKIKSKGRDPQRIAPPLHEVINTEVFELREYQESEDQAIDPYSAPKKAIADLIENLE